MKKIIAVFLGACILLSAEENFQKTSPRLPFDADLFQKDLKASHTDLEFLWWTIQEGSLIYGTKQNTAPTRNAYAGANGKYKRAEFDWAPGFRLTYGFFNAPKYWDAFIRYTWFYSSGNDHFSDKFLNAAWSSTLDDLNNAKSAIWLHHHLGDLLVARVFIPNPHLRMRTFGGISGGWIDQKWIVHYSNGLQNEKIDNQWRYWGVGPKLGLVFDWYWFWDFYLSGKVAWGGLLGKYQNRAKQKDLSNQTFLQDTSYEDYRYAYHVQFILGYSWQKAFAQSRVELFAGYEINHWWNLQEVYYSTKDAMLSGSEPRINSGGLTFHGLTMRMTLNF